LEEVDVNVASSKTGIRPELIQKIHEDFLYWYPVDLRNSAKELIPNHLTFFLFQHLAIFPKKLWPRGISVNGMITIEGKKMSKSRGIFTTIAKEIDKYGADVVRAALIYGAEQMDDPDWNENIAKLMLQKINSISELVLELRSNVVKRKRGFFEELLIAEVKEMVLATAENLELMKTKTAFQIAFFDIQNTIRRYLKQVGAPEAGIVELVTDYWLKTLSPFIPLICEELWHKIGGQTFISREEWPIIILDEKERALKIENKLVESLISDVKEIQKITKSDMKKVHIYVAPKELVNMVFDYLDEQSKGVSPKDAIKKMSGSVKDKKMMAYVPQIVKFSTILDKEVVNGIRKIKDFEEIEIYKENIPYIEKETGTRLEIVHSNQRGIHDPKGKAKNALPFRPAIFIE
jgi:leucyl-tRNA synthetase